MQSRAETQTMPADQVASCVLPAITSPHALLRLLDLDAREAPFPLAQGPAFSMLVPPSYAFRMRRGDWRDPLLLQVIPRADEEASADGFRADAVGDMASMAAPGLLHKYRGRALMLVSGCCPVNCRFCLRRAFPYSDLPRTEAQWASAWDYLHTHTDIRELILSGGEPLMVDNDELAGIADRFLRLEHLRTLRIHTRAPVVQPNRVDAELVEILQRCAEKKAVVVVVHANHAQELQADCSAALRTLREAGVMLLHQGVLLRHVNDTAEALEELMLALLDHGVLPYYLHQIDRVQGAAHFEVGEDAGREIMRELRRRLPGYAVPRYVREVAGAASKTPL